MPTLTRADLVSPNRKKQVVYSDFTNNFNKNPISNELVMVTNELSVIQAFKNLVKTSLGSRLFNPFFGSTVYQSLFELNDSFLVEDIQTSISVAASQFEPRVSVQSINVLVQPDQESITVDVVFSVVNLSQSLSVSVILQRVR